MTEPVVNNNRKLINSQLQQNPQAPQGSETQVRSQRLSDSQNPSRPQRPANSQQGAEAVQRSREPLGLKALGAALREAREAKKLTVEDISTMTCIRINFIEGIECGDYSRFKGLIYARGFVRTYLDIIGRKDLWPQFDRCLHDSGQTSDALTAKGKSVRQYPVAAPATGFKRNSKKLIISIFMLVILAGFVLLWMNWGSIQKKINESRQQEIASLESQKQKDESSRAQARQAEMNRIQEELKRKNAVSSDKTAVLTVPVSVPKPVPAPAAEVRKNELKIRATGKTWLRVQQDGKTIVNKMVNTGFEAVYSLNTPVRIRYGAAQHVVVSLNEKDLGSQGRGARRLEYHADGTVVPFKK